MAVTKQRVKTREEGELVFVDESVDVTQCTDKACEWSHTSSQQSRAVRDLPNRLFGDVWGEIRGKDAFFLRVYLTRRLAQVVQAGHCYGKQPDGHG